MAAFMPSLLPINLTATSTFHGTSLAPHQTPKPFTKTRPKLQATAAPVREQKPQPRLHRLNERGKIWIPQRQRPRRNRRNSFIRDMIRENQIFVDNLVYPLFVHDGKNDEDIGCMPGCKRLCYESVIREVGEVVSLGVRNVVLFPKIGEEYKSNYGKEAYNSKGLIPRLVSGIKGKYGGKVAVWCDVALDPYSDQGHDGVVSDDCLGDEGKGRVLNDETVEVLCMQAVCQARAGADVVAPSDMMDGRVGAIRDALDGEGFTDVGIVSYTAKYASAYYGPFRDALDSAPRESSNAPGNKKTYQMDPGNKREALIEAALDQVEGADMLMVKPGLPYLDVISALKGASDLPIAAYHVSGEYAMMKAAVERGWLDERQTVLETLLCFKRAGASAILTYYGKQAAQWLNE